MFPDKLIPAKILRGSEICGMEVLLQDGQFGIHFVVLKRKKNDIEILEKGELNDIMNLPEPVLKGKVPLCIVINGDCVLQRKLKVTTEEELENKIRFAFPTINPDDFYAQYYASNLGSGYVSIVRKSVVDPILTKLKTGRIDLVDCLFGNPAALNLQGLTSNQFEISTSNARILMNTNDIDQITEKESSEVEVDVFGLQFPRSEEHTS